MTWPLKCNENGLVPSINRGGGGTDLVGLAVGVEEGQSVETLVVLREAAEAEEERTNAHFYQHSSLVATLCGQGLGHLDHLSGGLWLPLSLTGGGLRSSLLRGGCLRRGGWDRQRMRTRVRRELGG